MGEHADCPREIGVPLHELAVLLVDAEPETVHYLVHRQREEGAGEE